MKSGITFHELAKLNREALQKQAPVTLEEARAQALWIKNTKLFWEKFGNGKTTIEEVKQEAIRYLTNISEYDYRNLYIQFKYKKFG